MNNAPTSTTPMTSIARNWPKGVPEIWKEDRRAAMARHSNRTSIEAPVKTVEPDDPGLGRQVELLEPLPDTAVGALGPGAAEGDDPVRFDIFNRAFHVHRAGAGRARDVE